MIYGEIVPLDTPVMTEDIQLIDMVIGEMENIKEVQNASGQ